MVAQSKKVPKSWPAKARELYSPLRQLGIGGFGTVWLAETKESLSSSSVLSQDKCVAIKLVGHPITAPMSKFEKKSEEGYFRREVEILQEISHPHIVKLVRCIEGEAEEYKNDSLKEASPYCMILQYCRGPTLHQLIMHGAAIGIPMAREVSSQLIDAVSYLHGRGVIHRDIKPDNIVIAGASISDESCWSDGTDGDDAAKTMKWQIKLLDFGLARPLHPDEIPDYEKNLATQQDEPDDDHFGRLNIDGALEDDADPLSSSNVSDSISRARVLNLSAVGQRLYASPEMLKGVRKFSNRSSQATRKQPLAECVADYGMVTDAFSTGSTIRFMLTGVPPKQSIHEFIAEKNSPINILGRKLKSKFGKEKGNTRKKKYRYTKDLPKEASKLVLGLTDWDERKRTTVRSARHYEWIKLSYSMQREAAHAKPAFNEHHGKIDFLKCALNRKV